MFESSTYAWLYRHDRDWLQKINDKISRIQKSNHSSVDWDKRDLELSSKIKKAILQLSEEQFESNIKIGVLCQCIPELKAKLERLDRLPLTLKVLQNSIGKKIQLKDKRVLL